MNETAPEEIFRLQSEEFKEPTPPVTEPFAPAEVAQVLVGLSDRGLYLQQAGLLKVRGFVVEIDGRSFDVLRNPKDQVDLCRMGLITLDSIQRDLTKAILPYHPIITVDRGKVTEENAQLGGLFNPRRRRRVMRYCTEEKAWTTARNKETA